MSDGIKLLLGPILALVPVVAWEFWLRPARVRRNTALSLLAELEINLHWILDLAAAREKKPTALHSSPEARRLMLTANAQQLGEFPPDVTDNLLRFYANVESAANCVRGIEDAKREKSDTSDDARRASLRKTIDNEHASLDAFISAATRRGESARVHLHEIARDVTFMDDVPPLRPFTKLVEASKARHRTD